MGRRSKTAAACDCRCGEGPVTVVARRCQQQRLQAVLLAAPLAALLGLQYQLLLLMVSKLRQVGHQVAHSGALAMQLDDEWCRCCLA